MVFESAKRSMTLSHIQRYTSRQPCPTRTVLRPPRLLKIIKSIKDEDKNLVLKGSLNAAKQNLAEGLSPGAGLATPEEQAEAAYADLILTSMPGDQTDNLTAEELESLQKGGDMPKEKSSGGIMDLFAALVGGAHIVRQSNGRI